MLKAPSDKIKLQQILPYLLAFLGGVALLYFGLRPSQRSIAILIHGNTPAYEMTDVQKKDIEEIKLLIKGRYPIMSIDLISTKEAKANTGIVKGPLDGAGKFYRLEKKNGMWQRKTDVSVMWMY